MKNFSPLLSVIVPVYNVEEYVKECLISILNQDYGNVEVIVVNDGSTDSSLQIIEIIEQQYCGHKQFHVYTKQNGGLSDARNFGLDKAKGDLITFVDSDDVLLQADIYSKVIGYFTCDDSVDVVQYDVIFKWNSSGEYKRDYPFKTYDTKEEISEGYLQEYIHVSCCDKVFRKKVFAGVRFPLNQQSEDIAIIPELIERMSKLKVADIGYYGYRYREGSISTSHLCAERVIGVLQSYFSYLNYTYTFPKLMPLSIQCYVNIIWNYCSLVRKYDKDNINKLLTSSVFIRINLWKWLMLSMKLKHEIILKSFIACVLGPVAIIKIQKIFTR